MVPTNTLPNVAHYMKEITLYLRNCCLNCELVLVVIGRCLGAVAFPVWKAVHLLPPTTLPFCFPPFSICELFIAFNPSSLDLSEICYSVVG